MLGRTRTFGGRCRFELQQCRSLSSPPPPPELPRLHYPAGSGGRKYRTGQEARLMSSAEINRILKVRKYITESVSQTSSQTDLSSVVRPTNTAMPSPEDPPPMVSWVSIATCCHPTTLVRTVGAVLPACQAVVASSLVCLTAMRGRRVLRPSARGSSTILPWQLCHCECWWSSNRRYRKNEPYCRCWSGTNTPKTTAAPTEEQSLSTASETTGRRGWRMDTKRRRRRRR